MKFVTVKPSAPKKFQYRIQAASRAHQRRAPRGRKGWKKQHVALQRCFAMPSNKFEVVSIALQISRQHLGAFLFALWNGTLSHCSASASLSLFDITNSVCPTYRNKDVYGTKSKNLEPAKSVL